MSRLNIRKNEKYKALKFNRMNLFSHDSLTQSFQQVFKQKFIIL